MRCISVLGAGRWGTAFALYLSRLGYEVTLQANSRKTLAYLRQHDASPYLPGETCGGKIAFTTSAHTALSGAEALIVSIPVVYLRQSLQHFPECSPHIPIIGINKGIEEGTLKIPAQIIAEFYPKNPYAQLGGPCFPAGLLNTKPAAETLACQDQELGLMLQKAFSAPSFRVYLSADVIGVSYLGALKNVYAIAAGIMDALHLGEEACSVFIARALAEVRRFCRTFGIAEQTLYGLSGLGDLTLTCYSQSSSQNKTFGNFLGNGYSVADALVAMNGKVAEGHRTAQALAQIIEQRQLTMPIATAVHAILEQGANPREKLTELMQRPLKVED